MKMDTLLYYVRARKDGKAGKGAARHSQEEKRKEKRMQRGLRKGERQVGEKRKEEENTKRRRKGDAGKREEAGHDGQAAGRKPNGYSSDFDSSCGMRTEV